MKGQVQIVVAGVGLANSRADRLVGIVAGKPDTGGAKIGLHRVRDLVHDVLFVAAAGVGVVFLHRRAEKNGGHDHSSFKEALLFW